MKKYYLTIFFFCLVFSAKSQLNVAVITKINTDCNGNPCNYSGPTILINEVMLSPINGDGSIYGFESTRRGEWIELYNPDICQSIDVSCYFLGNNTPNSSGEGITNYGGGFVIPGGTVVPPRGFVIIRGTNAPPVPTNLLIQNGGKTLEIVVDEVIINRICLGGGNRLWFPNTGGWFAFYDKNGVPQDAISWCSQTNSCMTCNPCNPQVTTCGFSGTLDSYSNIAANKKNYITSFNPQDYQGLSLRRIPDGGTWNSNPSSPTYGNCNSFCNPPPVISCNGMAIAIPSGGLPPYTFLWNDQQYTTNDTVTGLCQGTYLVRVIDANYDTVIVNVQIENLELKATVNINNLSCMGGNNASASVAIINGASPYSYSWNTNDTISGIYNLSSGTYQVAFSDTNGCIGDTIAVIPESHDTLKVNTNNAVICSGTSVKLIATPSITGGVFQWTPGGQQTSQITVTPLNTINYSVVYSLNGCVAKDTSLITVNVQPHVSIYCSRHIISPEDSAVLLAMGGALSYYWNNGLTTNQIIVYPKEDTVFCVLASNNNGCFDSTCIKIDVRGISTLYVPNAFTPNNNGLNDLFLVGSTNIEKFHIVIYNRWGNLLFETNDINVGWDGRYYGNLVPEGVYVYSIDAIGEDQKVYRKHGSLTVLR